MSLKLPLVVAFSRLNVPRWIPQHLHSLHSWNITIPSTLLAVGLCSSSPGKIQRPRFVSVPLRSRYVRIIFVLGLVTLQRRCDFVAGHVLQIYRFFRGISRDIYPSKLGGRPDEKVVMTNHPVTASSTFPGSRNNTSTLQL